MITLQQVQELRGRIDNLRIALLTLKDDNSFLRQEVVTLKGRIKELEEERRLCNDNEENVQSEVINIIEEIDKELQSFEIDGAADVEPLYQEERQHVEIVGD